MEDTIKTTTTKQPRFTLAAEFDGFPFTVTFRGKTEKLKEIVAALKQQGVTPPARPTVQPEANSTAQTKGESKPPKCPDHSIPMKPSRKKGQTWYCPKSLGDGTYCEEYV